jgi:hypothetical protein
MTKHHPSPSFYSHYLAWYSMDDLGRLVHGLDLTVAWGVALFSRWSKDA